jgi:uncharacterized membrane protein (DUF485 family)
MVSVPNVLSLDLSLAAFFLFLYFSLVFLAGFFVFLTHVYSNHVIIAH